MNMIEKIIISLSILTFLFLLSSQQNQINELKLSSKYKDSLYLELYNSIIDSVEKESYIVTVTTYLAVKGQTDNTPFITSCGLKIDPNNPSKHRYISLSRDLLGEFYYGEQVEIQNCGKFNGIYIVADCCNKRLLRTVDILIGRHTVGGKFKNVVLKHIQ